MAFLAAADLSHAAVSLRGIVMCLRQLFCYFVRQIDVARVSVSGWLQLHAARQWLTLLLLLLLLELPRERCHSFSSVLQPLQPVAGTERVRCLVCMER